MQPVLEEHTAGVKLTTLRVQNFFAYKNRADFARLRDGLKKAGVPEATFDMDEKIKDRLTDQEIAELLVGHEAEGRNTDKPEDLHLAMAQGTAEVRVGERSSGGTVTIEENSFCIYFRTLWRNCYFAYRNPEGTPASKNEFILVSPIGRGEFSIVK